MAFLQHLLNYEPEFYLPNIFNVSHSVGENAANYWTDIQLVQLFIKGIYVHALQAPGGGWGMVAKRRDASGDFRDLPDPNKDFKALTKTAKWIRNFQTDMNEVNGYRVPVNGRAERSFGLNSTIWDLNLVYRDTLKPLGIEIWDDYFLSDPAMPNILRTQLLTNNEGKLN